MNRWDQLGSLFWLVISIIVCVESIRARVGTFKNPGPGFLLLWAGVILGIFAIILLTTSILRKRVEDKITNPFKGLDLWKIILVMASLFAYSFLLSWGGYIIMTFGLMVFLFSAIRRGRVWIDVTIALITVLASYIVFFKWLGIQLPRGIFGF
jgi:hypothetical protein